MTYTIDRYGYRYSIDVDDAVMEESYKRGELVEQGMLDWIVANVPKGGIWVDCGANVGEHSLTFVMACKADLVFAFEPMTENYARLVTNLKELAQCEVIPLKMAVGIGATMCRMVPAAQGRNSQYTAEKTMVGDYAGSCMVPTVGLDAIVPWDGVRVLKIDVEGAERIALQTASGIIHESRPEIFVEIWEQKTLDWAISWLGMRGYLLIECYGEAPCFHFSASGRYPVTYKPRQLQ